MCWSLYVLRVCECAHAYFFLCVGDQGFNDKTNVFQRYFMFFRKFSNYLILQKGATVCFPGNLRLVAKGALQHSPGIRVQTRTKYCTNGTSKTRLIYISMFAHICDIILENKYWVKQQSSLKDTFKRTNTNTKNLAFRTLIKRAERSTKLLKALKLITIFYIVATSERM